MCASRPHFLGARLPQAWAIYLARAYVRARLLRGGSSPPASDLGVDLGVAFALPFALGDATGDGTLVA